RNLARTWREQTDPVLEYAADFINARLRPITIEGPEPADPGIESDETTYQQAGPERNEQPARAEDSPQNTADTSPDTPSLEAPPLSDPASGPWAAGSGGEPDDQPTADRATPVELLVVAEVSDVDSALVDVP